ncbi:DUF2730 family protein [Rhizobium sp. YJ-22]|uniref:DUF2730 family protein n=1 Tax=Rhizobium sp. YJ-22 TaxID=3037556 RepID=UPI002412851B|nr:DUF2730 family protein [Rhizobium sp. YJ-22]MDG3575990.1 DUF2730 family protein [Rhizobium sp. YJ-22]
MDLAIILPWITAALSIIAFLTAIKNILGSPAKENAEKISKHDQKLIEHDRRIQAVESDFKHLPNRDTAHNLELALAQISGRLNSMDAQISGRLNAMDERLNPIAATSVRLQEFLLDQVKK